MQVYPAAAENIEAVMCVLNAEECLADLGGHFRQRPWVEHRVVTKIGEECCWICKTSDRIVGTVILDRPNTSTMTIEAVAVLHPFCHQRVATSLVAAVAAQASLEAKWDVTTKPELYSSVTLAFLGSLECVKHRGHLYVSLLGPGLELLLARAKFSQCFVVSEHYQSQCWAANHACLDTDMHISFVDYQTLIETFVRNRRLVLKDPRISLLVGDVRVAEDKSSV